MAGDDMVQVGNNRTVPRNMMSRRSPSILVTDARSTKKRSSAPFAGNANTRRDKTGGSMPTVIENRAGRRMGPMGGREFMPKAGSGRTRQGKFSEVSMDNILSEMSDVPSGRRQERLSSSSFEYERRPAHYNKTIRPLPSRTSKTSEKFVLIPDENVKRFAQGFHKRSASRVFSELSYGEHNTAGLPSITAYNVAEGFNLNLASQFLKETHNVSIRRYDECLYVPYCLPLLPGKDGFRIRSNVSKKMVGGKTLIDRLIDTSEQRDHHYEYYSGVETVEDMHNNFEINENGNGRDPDGLRNADHLAPLSSNMQSFDPSEPQFFAEELSEIGLHPIQDSSSEQHEREKVLDAQQHAEIFIFNYGVIVFWNFTELEEKNILGDIAFSGMKNMVTRPLDEQDIEIEQFHFEYDMDTERPRIFNDIITLRSGDHIIKLTLSHAIAQSTKLSRFEKRITPILGTVSKLPKRLALYGTLGLKREQLLKKSGKLFKLRVDVNLSSSVLDTPEFFWSFEPSLHPLYTAMREYLEIDPRVQVLNDRCKVFLEFFDICVNSIAEKDMARITWWLVIVIFISVLVSTAEILVRYFIIKRH
ncbi:AFR265Cp [Eremothecium gossypii ATCC 10895]|uniref:AFR265Cp n=1 Tax=Eremothecium gossypii (strain ATCC 10895 / CBS 109.51 / FGSC 9923 / NRRL Y-1056) TaxID=284811 RepID=Q753P7_EREGS|nr:AFR265Cp [Eremothecium gossypii ATCC 10895]AAS53636.2 AFR265Cp [Eremothecium gossypii ATCC 10895]AEY97949.1 FAFR265Cp [Eremothecium gossypii FDAG1]